jgi:NADH-quinone oxidoreductase subunit N
MSTPLVWIVIPALIAAILYLFRRWHKSTAAVGILISVLLAWLAWLVPIGEAINIGPFSAELSDMLVVLGRRFVLDTGDRPILILIYLGVAFWFGGSIVARTDRLFVPLGLSIAALLTAALAVEPFLYAALLIEMAALVSVPMLSSPGNQVGRGVVRFVTFQSLGMPFILYTGWMLAGVEAAPGDSQLILHAEILMGMGFAFFMAVFPFHTWIPMLAEEAHPYTAAFVFFLLTLVISFFGLSFIDRYAWLRTSVQLYFLLRLSGALMVLVGGIWSAFQRHLGRMMGYAVLVEIGLSLLAVGDGLNSDGKLALLGIFFALILPRGLGLGVWSLALAAIKNKFGELRFRSIQGVGRQMPIASASLVLAQFSMAGFPLLAGFPVRLALWLELAQRYPLESFAALIGSAGLLAGGLRALAVLVMGSREDQWQISENWDQRILLVLGGLALFVLGVFPQWFLPGLAHMAGTYVHLSP